LFYGDKQRGAVTGTKQGEAVMVTKTVYLTPEGKHSLEQELDRLLTRREELLKRIQEEREFGAFAEGSEPDADKQDLAFVEGRIITIQNQLREAVVIASHDQAQVSLGSTVRVKDQDGVEETFTIVGSPEAKPMEGRISNESPVGHALIGKRVGEKVSVKVPSGILEYTVQAIS
jgi:transcription elongation factor GreA